MLHSRPMRLTSMPSRMRQALAKQRMAVRVNSVPDSIKKPSTPMDGWAAVQVICKSKSRLNNVFKRLSGAVNAIRTHDLILTKDVLCRLSYNSKWRPG